MMNSMTETFTAVTMDCTVELWNINLDKIGQYDKIGN
jgi:hypothetical protein